MSASATELIARYERDAAGGGAQAWAELLAGLRGAPESAWLTCSQRLVLRGRADLAAQLLAQGHAQAPDSVELAFALAGLEASRRNEAAAETLLRAVLSRQPAHAAAALLLADLLRKQARSAAAATVLRACFEPHRHDADTVIRALELLDDIERKADAASIAQAEIAAGSTDARLHAYAATYLMQLGEFDRARERYLFAYAHSTQAAEWDVPFGLASTRRYREYDDDFALFERCLARTDLSPRARTTLLFGMGKAWGDIGEYARAAQYLTQANEQGRALWPWARKPWRRGVDARMQAPPLPRSTHADEHFAPIFVVGVPRSGTTLVAELLARHAQVCNRGESPWIWHLAQRLAATPKPDAVAMDAWAQEYRRQIRQDDAGDAQWFVDKQPLNVLHVGLILAMFPDARIVYCKRGARDVALSLWTQFFREPSYAFAYDFADIAAVQQGVERIMAHWLKRHPDSIRTVQYEDLAARPTETVQALATWIGLHDIAADPSRDAAINTASIWQARQPVYTSSVDRWRAYAPFVPELLRFAER